MEMTVERNFGVWNQALLTDKDNIVANLYTQEATFLPFFLPDFKKGRDGVREYFEYFLTKKPESWITEEAVQILPVGSIIHSGFYDLEVGSKDRRELVLLRFTFVWRPDEKIAHHHSSLMPQLRVLKCQGESLFQQGPETEMAGKFFSKWGQALLSKDKDVVADLYAEDATFLPTLSPDLKRGQAGAREYFEHFPQKDPNGRIIEEVVQLVPVGAILHSGLYEFEVGPKDRREVVPARFTFLWLPNGSIDHHHSSLQPVVH